MCMLSSILGSTYSLVQVQEADQCTEVWSEPDPQQAFHALVVPHHQPCQCVCGLPSAAGSNRHLHARQDPHTQDLSHPDLQGSPVAEGARECGHGLVSLCTASTPLHGWSNADCKLAFLCEAAHVVYTQICPILRVLATILPLSFAASHQVDAWHISYLHFVQSCCLEIQDLSCMYFAPHELESVVIMIMN